VPILLSKQWKGNGKIGSQKKISQILAQSIIKRIDCFFYHNTFEISVDFPLLVIFQIMTNQLLGV